jgi:GBP family porin
MKKHLIAATVVAGLTCATYAHADSVTLYGIVDAGIGYNKMNHGSVSQSHVQPIQGVQNGSRFGMRGTEALGGGTRAVFKLEGGFNTNRGTSAQGNRLFGRQAWVGLENDVAGGLYFGRQSNGADAYLDSIDPFGTGFGLAGTDTVFSNTLRADNMLTYKTPNFAGFSGLVGYSFNVDGVSGPTGFQNNENDRLLTFGGIYDNGPLHLLASYDYYAAPEVKGAGLLGSNIAASSVRSSVLGATYDFEVVKVYAAVGRTSGGWLNGKDIDGELRSDEKMSGTRLAPGFKATSTMLGVTAPLGAGTLMGSWQRADPSNDKLTGKSLVMTVYSLGYRYDLSKRTSLYSYGAFTNHFAFLNVQDRTAGVGVRHIF